MKKRGQKGKNKEEGYEVFLEYEKKKWEVQGIDG
jgi:hypothetical protein